MCNCKGFDVIETENEVYIEPHFCRIHGDCGSVDRTYDEVRQELITDLYESIDYLNNELTRIGDSDSGYSEYLVERIDITRNKLERLFEEMRDGK